jgi:hypothetical protein
MLLAGWLAVACHQPRINAPSLLISTDESKVFDKSSVFMFSTNFVFFCDKNLGIYSFW